MKFEWKPVKGEMGAGACSDCHREILSKNGLGLDYPYENVCEIKIGSTVVRLCRECMGDLILKATNALKKDF
jgi:hypothetical protein